MPRHGVRVLVAILTFTIGLALVWALQLIPRLETAVVNRFVGDTHVSAIPAFFDATEDSNQIYRLLIQRRLRDKTKSVVLGSQTTGDTMYENDKGRTALRHNETFQEMMKGWFPNAELQTLDNYLEQNKTSEPLRVQNLGITYELVTLENLQTTDQFRSFWTTFYKNHPRSAEIVYFSKVGFNDQHDQALVYTGNVCGGLCGSTHYLLLRKVNGKWEIEDQTVSGIS